MMPSSPSTGPSRTPRTTSARIREVFAAWRTEVEAVDWPLFGEFEE